MNLRIMTKNYSVDSEIGFLTTLISKSYCRATAIPPAWVLKGSLLVNFYHANYCLTRFSDKFSLALRFPVMKAKNLNR